MSTKHSVTRRGFRLIVRFVKTHPWPFAVSVAGAVLFAAAAVGSTVVVGRVTDSLITPAFSEGVTAGAVIGGMLALFLVAALRGTGVVVRRYFASLTEARMQMTLRQGVLDKYLDVPLAYHQAKPTGELLAHSDADVVGTTLMIKALPFSIGVLALVAFALVSLLLVDLYFTAVALLLFPSLAALNRYYTNRVEEPSARVQQEIGDVSTVAHESIDGALVVKTLGREEAEVRRLAEAADRLRRGRLEVGRLRAFFEPMIDVIPNLGIVALLLVGAWQISRGAVSEGELVQAMMLFTLLGFPMRVVGFLLEEMPRAVVAVERIDRVLGAEEAAEYSSAASELLPEGPLEIAVEDVTFGYDGTAVLQGVSLKASPGETVAIVGSTGTGKSTINQLLVRLAEPRGGQVRLGGVDLSRLDPEQLRQTVALVFQETFLFAATIRENITLGRDVGEDTVRHAASVAQADRFICHLPEGYETVVGERGVTLSGGQRQRVALARALAGSPRVLLLDDATSAVDPVVEGQILEGLRRTNDMTTLIVAHRLSTILLADRVVYVDGGRVCASGTHRELLDVPGYEALVRAYEVAEHEGSRRR